MTNEEAIKAMTKYMPKDNDSVSLVLREAMNMGIKALEQEPCDDAVSRQEVLKQLKGCLTGGETEYKYVKAHIDTIPPVTPQPKIGRWIDITNKNGTVIAIRCDCCGNSPKHAIRSNSCPNCGAKILPTDLQFGDQDTLMSAT